MGCISRRVYVFEKLSVLRLRTSAVLPPFELLELKVSESCRDMIFPKDEEDRS